MAAEEKLGEIYVAIKADLADLRKDMASLKGQSQKDKRELEKNYSFKARFDNATARLKISELQQLRDKLQKEFDRKIALDVDGASIERTRQKLASVNQSLNGIEQQTERSVPLFERLGLAITAAFATERIIRFGFEAVQLAAKVEGIEAAFNRLNQPGLLSELRSATQGTVADWQLMQTAVKAANFKIPLTELATLLEFAKKKANQTGQEVDYLVNSIIDGIGRKSILVLDNLQISASEIQEEFKKTGDFAKATANVVNRELEKMGDVAGTTADEMARLNVEIENQKTKIGKDLTPVYRGFLWIVSKTIDAVRWQIDKYGMLREEAERLIETHRRYGAMLMQTHKINAIYKEQVDTIGKIKEKIDNLVQSQDNMVYGSKEYLEAQKQIEQLERSIGLGKNTEKQLSDYEKTKKRLEEIKVEMQNHNLSAEQLNALLVERISLMEKLKKSTTVEMGDIKPRGLDQDAVNKMQQDFAEQNKKNLEERIKLRMGLQVINTGIVEDNRLTTDAIVQDWIEKNELAVAAQNSMVEGFTNAFHEIRIRTAQDANAMEKIFADMANAFIREVQRMIAQWLVLQALKMIFNVATGGAGAAVPVPGGATGGVFKGTPRGVKKMANGGSFKVPDGFSNDTYPMLLTSKEVATVQTPSQVNASDRYMKQLVGRMDVMNNNLLEMSMRTTKIEGNIAVHGKFQGGDIYLSNRKAEKRIGLLS